MIAAKLLVELGEEPQEAIAKVRVVRPGAIETREQERYVLAQKASQIGGKTFGVSSEDRLKGAMVGLAVGDALGTTIEFCPRDT